MDIHIEVGEPQLVAGVGPGGSGKEMRKVTLNGDLVGYLGYREYQREGGIHESYMTDGTTMFGRNHSAEILALDLAARRLRSSVSRSRPASASA